MRSNLRNRFSVAKKKLSSRTRKLYSKGNRLVQKRPLLSLGAILLLLLLFIVLGSVVRRPDIDESEEEEVISEVDVYSIGEVPRASFQAVIEKSGIVSIVAVSGGIVNTVHVQAGQNVSQGTLLVSLSNNYSGGNALSLQRQLASASYTTALQTQELQKELIAKQREIAAKNDENSDELRDISDNSIEANESLLEFNRGIIDSLESNLEDLESNPAGNEDLILSTKQMISQFRSGVNQLEAGLDQTRYSTDDDNPPAKLSDLQREVTLKQLELQEKNLSLSLETSRLQLRLAQVQEAVMFPTAPFAGVVERVHVKEGTYVNPGSVLVTLHGEQTVQAIARVPREIARSVSAVEPSVFLIGNETYETAPFYVSTEATDGRLYSIQYALPEHFQDLLTHKSFVSVEIPLGYPDTGKTIPFVPIESVYQTQDSAYIFLFEDGFARSKEVELGSVQGQYVEIRSGIDTGALVILDRDVIDGEQVTISE